MSKYVKHFKDFYYLELIHAIFVSHEIPFLIVFDQIASLIYNLIKSGNRHLLGISLPLFSALYLMHFDINL